MLLVVAVVALTISVGIYAYTKHIDGASKVGHDDSSSSSSSKQNHYHAMTDDPIDGASAGMGAGMVGGGGGGSSTTSVKGLYDAMSDKANTLIDTLTTGLENVGRHEIDDGMEGEVKESLINDNDDQANDTNHTRLLDSENEGSGI